MGCSSCAVSKDGGTAVAGCGSSGSCGCNKLAVHDWLLGMRLPEGQNVFPFVEVQFKGTRKEFFKNKDGLPLKSSDVVAVEATSGHDIGVVSMVGEMVRLQMKKKEVKSDNPEIKTVYRFAKDVDIDKWKEVQQLENPVMLKTRLIAKQLKLNMKVNDIEYQGDKKKFTVYYTAEHRVDFRELIKKLSDEFKTRVEMRQIGLRQEAGRLGGLGDCGRELCCSTWLSDFRTVNTAAARYQNLSLNPAKLSGQCGKLKCCLNYELDSYQDAIKDFPDTDKALHTQKGKAVHQKTDIFKRMMWYSYIGEVKGQDQSDGWVPLPVDRVKEIIKLNKEEKKPFDLRDAAVIDVEIVKTPDYENVVGQDSLTRMDNKFKKKKKKKRKPSGGGGTAPANAAGAPPQNKGPRPNNQRPNNSRPSGPKPNNPKPPEKK